jgi:hypothetical protein
VTKGESGLLSAFSDGKERPTSSAQLVRDYP